MNQIKSIDLVEATQQSRALRLDQEKVTQVTIEAHYAL